MIDWSLSPLFSSFAVVAIMGGLLFAAWFFIREQRTLEPKRATTLAVLRLLTIVLFLILMLKPGITLTKTSSPQSAVALLVDLSKSMELPSQRSNQTRWELQKEIVDEVLSYQAKLGDESPIVVYGYENRLQSLTQDGIETLLKQPPTGELTEVGGPLQELLSVQSDPPLSSVIWIGDARQTRSPTNADAQQLAQQYSRLDIPMFFLGLGAKASEGNVRDIAIENTPEQIEAYTKNRVQITGMLQARGAGERTVDVELLVRAPDGEFRLIATDQIATATENQQIPFGMELVAPQPGAYELLIRTPAIQGEITEQNNEAYCFLNVRRGGSRVLFLEGEPRAEQQFIRRAVAESEEFLVDYQWIPQARNLNQWPHDFGNLLESDIYDAYIIGDLDSYALGRKAIGQLAENIRNGAGLITLGGFHAYGAGGYSVTDLSKILPVDVEMGARQNFGTPINWNFHFREDIKVQPITNHPVVNFGTPEETRAAWESLQPVRGANRWRSVQNFPGVSVLATGKKDNQPLIVVGSAGNGRVLCIAFDTSYRWWRSGKSELHKQFWRQSVLWCMRRTSKEESIELTMPERRLYRGQQSTLALKWNGGADMAPVPDDLKVVLQKSEDQVLRQISMRRASDQELESLIQAPPSGSGRFEIVATATGSEGQPLTARLPFLVWEQSVELANPVTDWELIEQMAALNKEAGGEVIAVEKIDEMIEAIVERKRTSEVETIESFRLGDTSPDSWGLLLVFVGLVSAQWGLRKRWGLA